MVQIVAGEKVLSQDALLQWEQELRKKSLSESTRSQHMSLLKGFLTYLENPDQLRETVCYHKSDELSSEQILPRDEYHRIRLANLCSFVPLYGLCHLWFRFFHRPQRWCHFRNHFLSENAGVPGCLCPAAALDLGH